VKKGVLGRRKRHTKIWICLTRRVAKPRNEEKTEIAKANNDCTQWKKGPEDDEGAWFYLLVTWSFLVLTPVACSHHTPVLLTMICFSFL
jgi:hypothetical protein